jgi:AcrR family transcriptional regulator
VDKDNGRRHAIEPRRTPRFAGKRVAVATGRTRLRAHTAEILVARESCEGTLRDLADELNTSSRMLIHHFGSRDALIAAGLAHARSELLTACRNRLTAENPRDLRGLVATLRAIIADPAHRRSFRLFDEVNALAVIRGLVLDENATQEHARVDAAFEVFERL